MVSGSSPAPSLKCRQTASAPGASALVPRAPRSLHSPVACGRALRNSANSSWSVTSRPKKPIEETRQAHEVPGPHGADCDKSQQTHPVFAAVTAVEHPVDSFAIRAVTKPRRRTSLRRARRLSLPPRSGSPSNRYNHALSSLNTRAHSWILRANEDQMCQQIARDIIGIN